MEKRELIEQFIFSMQSIHRYIRSGTFDEQKPPITRVQWLILRQLYRRGESTLGQLAKRLDVRPSTMSQMIDRLEKVHLVCRTVASFDARTRVVRLTDDGQTKIRQIEAIWIDSLADPFDQLTPDEHVLLIQLMTKLASNLPKRGGNLNE